MGRPRKTAKQTTESIEDRSARETVIHMKGSPDYVEWLDDVHRRTHIPEGPDISNRGGRMGRPERAQGAPGDMTLDPRERLELAARPNQIPG